MRHKKFTTSATKTREVLRTTVMAKVSATSERTVLNTSAIKMKEVSRTTVMAKVSAISETY